MRRRRTTSSSRSSRFSSWPSGGSRASINRSPSRRFTSSTRSSRRTQAEEALAAPTTADGGGEDAEAKLDEAVARAGEDPLGPALDAEEEDPLDDEDARADAELEEVLARVAQEPLGDETPPETSVAHDEAEAEAMREEPLAPTAADDSFAPADVIGGPSAAVLDSEEDVAHSGAPAAADPNASDDE